MTDSTNYLESIGRTRIAEVIRDAEIAESNAMAEAKEKEAHAKREAEVASETAQTSIVQFENDLRRLQADLEANVRSAEEQATAQALQARAEAEAELQEIRRELEQIRLLADQVLPAEANKTASELKAQGQAAFGRARCLGAAQPKTRSTVTSTREAAIPRESAVACSI